MKPIFTQQYWWGAFGMFVLLFLLVRFGAQFM